MQASGQQVLAVRPVRVPLGLVRVIAQALVDAALEQHQTTQAIARGLEVAGVGVPLLEPVVLVCPDVLDLEGPGAALRDEILEIGGQVALGVEPVRQACQDVANLPVVLIVQAEPRLAREALRLLVELRSQILRETRHATPSQFLRQDEERVLDRRVADRAEVPDAASKPDV